MAQAMKKGVLDTAGYDALIETTTRLNTVGSALAELPEVHALTDVTGFGLLGHALEVCRGAGLAAELRMAQIPLIAGARALAEQGIGPGAIERNFESFGADCRFALEVTEWQRRLLADPQTSGGLLVSVAPAQAPAVLALIREAGFTQAAQIGRMVSGPVRIEVIG